MSASGGILLKNSKAEADEIPRRGGPEVDDLARIRPVIGPSGPRAQRLATCFTCPCRFANPAPSRNNWLPHGVAFVEFYNDRST